MKRTILMMFLTSISFFSCSSDDDSSSDDDMTDVGGNAVTYANEVSQLISANCLGCHGETLANEAPISLHTFELLTGSINSVEFRINDMVNPMPPQGLMSEEDRAIIDDWISGGLLEN